MFQARQNEPIVLYDRANETGAGANTMTRLPSRTPQSDHPWIANPNGTATRTRSLPKHGACAAKRRRASRSYESRTGPTKTALADAKTRFHERIPMAHAYRLAADGCGRLRTVANGCERLVANGCELWSTPCEHGLHPQTPTYKREPFATHSGKTCVSPHRKAQKEGSVLEAFCVLLRRNANCIHSLPSPFFTSLRSLRQLAAPHLAGARHSAANKTLEKRRCGLHEGSEFGTCALQLDQVESIAPLWQTTFRILEKTSLVNSCFLKQSSGRAYDGQACAQCYNAAVGRRRLPLSGARAVLERSSRRVSLPWSGVCAVL